MRPHPAPSMAPTTPPLSRPTWNRSRLPAHARAARSRVQSTRRQPKILSPFQALRRPSPRYPHRPGGNPMHAFSPSADECESCRHGAGRPRQLRRVARETPCSTALKPPTRHPPGCREARWSARHLHQRRHRRRRRVFLSASFRTARPQLRA